MVPANWTAEQVTVLLLAAKITPLLKVAESIRRTRLNHATSFKAKVALAAIKGDHTFAQLVERFEGHPNKITQWKTELLQRAAEVFATAAEKRETGPDIKMLHAKIGQLALENEALRDLLRQEGCAVGYKHDATLMRAMDLEALYRKANTD